MNLTEPPILRSRPGFFGGSTVQIGPVAHVKVDVGSGGSLTCIEMGLLLLTTEHGPVAVLVEPATSRRSPAIWKLRLQAIAAERATSEHVLADIDSERRKRSVFRGRTISLHVDGQRARQCASTTCRRSPATRSSCPPACSSASSATRSRSPSTPSGCARRAGT